jgi:glycosyltransferase involved in cell wall biosynthesis
VVESADGCGLPIPKNLRVAFYSHAFEIGGAEVFLRGLLAKLPPDITTLLVSVNDEVSRAVTSNRENTLVRLVPPVRNRHDLSAIAAHARALRRFSPHVTHINQGHVWSGQYGMLASALARTPAIGVVHAVFPPANEIQRRLTILLARSVQRFVAVSKFVEHALEQELKVPRHKITIIPNGIALESAGQPQDGRDPHLIAAIGRMAPEKGFDLLIEAMIELEGVQLLLIGDGPERERLERQARELGVSSAVRFMGWTDDPWSIRPRPSLLVVPSRRDAAPLVILEAMREGVPVVASRVGGIPEQVVDKKTGLLVEPGYPSALAESIRTLLADPETLDDMSRNAISRIEDVFSLHLMTSRYLDVYRSFAPFGADLESWDRHGKARRSESAGDLLRHP